MANRLLKETEDITPKATPKFMSSLSDTQEIARVGTTGMQTMDMMFNHANKIASNIESLGRSNEWMELQNQANENIKNYESSFEGNKYDDENYDKYVEGLKDVYEQNKKLIGETKYTTASDVDKWNNSMEQDKTNEMYTNKGFRSQYINKKMVDRTQVNLDNSMNSYTQTGDNNFLKQGIKLIDGLDKVGISDMEREKMKVDLILKANSRKMDKDLDDIVNDPELSSQDKKDKLDLIRAGFKAKGVLEKDVENMIGEGLLNKDENLTKMYRDRVDYQLKNDYLGSKGKIYNAQMKLYNNYNKKIEKVNKEVMDAYSDRRNGNNLNLVATLENRAVSETDLLANSKRYFGKTSEEMESEGSFVSLFSTTDINTMKNGNKIAVQNNVPRNERVAVIYDNLGIANKETKDYTPEESMKVMQLINKGVISQFEVDNINMKGGEDLIKQMDYGENNKQANKLNNFFWVRDAKLPSYIKDAIKKATPEQREMLSTLTTGYAVAHPEAGILDAKGQVSDIQISRVLKDKNSVFHDVFRGWLSIDEKGNLLGVVGTYKPKIYKENIMKVDDDTINYAIQQNNNL